MSQTTLTTPSLQDFTSATSVETTVANDSGSARRSVSRLVSLATEGLPQMFDRNRNLFCYKLKKSDSGLVQEGISHRYTMMTLLGLHRLQQSGKQLPINCESVLNTLVSDLGWIDNIGDLGVLLWLCAVVVPERLPDIHKQIDVETALDRYQDARQGFTMELSWFLTGLCYSAQTSQQELLRFEKLALRTYDLIKKNQGTDFFGHLSRLAGVSGRLRGQIGSFADQVYPIYAMTQLFKAYGHSEAAELASNCAEAICRVQGSLGQWWWHYDSLSGQVTDGYPVFSVHQHAMAPMTLFALGDAIGRDFDPYIYKGLNWINANNELDFNMEDADARLVWRCIYRFRRSQMRYLKARFGINSDALRHEGKKDLKVLFECRPYELGWLLYAFANRRV